MSHLYGPRKLSCTVLTARQTQGQALHIAKHTHICQIICSVKSKNFRQADVCGLTATSTAAGANSRTHTVNAIVKLCSMLQATRLVVTIQAGTNSGVFANARQQHMQFAATGTRRLCHILLCKARRHTLQLLLHGQRPHAEQRLQQAAA